MLMPYVHGHAQPVGKLLTRDALQLMEGRPHQERFVLDTPSHLPIKHQRININEGKKSVWDGKFNNFVPSAPT